MANVETYRIKPDGIEWCPFYDSDKPNYIFTNFSQQPLKVNGITYPSPEHYFQAQKFPLPEYKELHMKIASEKSSRAARLLADIQYNAELKKSTTFPKWSDGIAYKAMLNVIRARAEEKEFKEALENTRDAYLYEDTYSGPPTGGPPDARWGGGADGTGKNLLGKALMEVRNEIYKKQHQDHLIVNIQQLYDKAIAERKEIKTTSTPMQSFAKMVPPVASMSKAETKVDAPPIVKEATVKKHADVKSSSTSVLMKNPAGSPIHAGHAQLMDDKHKPTSLFNPVCIDFSKNDEKQQAEMILEEVNYFYQKGYKQVGITYSANHDQTEKINQDYKNGQWYTGTSGANQADVMSHVESLLKTDSRYAHLQSVFRILPITTCEHEGAATKVDEKKMDQWLDHDLQNVNNFMKQDKNVVIGWQNQLTKDNKAAPFAIGGGVSQAQLTAQQNQKIQTCLSQLHQNYPVPNDLKHDIKHVASAVKTVPNIKSIPVTPEMDVACKQVGVSIRQDLKASVSMPLIRQGNMNGTFKVAFKTAEEASLFYQRLQNLINSNALGIELNNVTFHNKNGKEEYGMDAQGNIVGRSGEYNNIVRFEIPDNALAYLKHINVNNAEELYRSVMTAPENKLNLKL